ncbi:MAG: ATP--guanido phosphotransferase [Planctomycetia bacterium]|nr:ATP--guanido phosphotransferase [Planctomycetia bacterium]
MSIDDLVLQQQKLFASDFPESHTVISSRIRLARNWSAYPFVTKMDPAQQAEVELRLRRVLEGVAQGECDVFFMDKVDDFTQTLLLECHFASPEMIRGEEARSVVVLPGARSSAMLMEEDHIRIQTIRGGLALHDAWEELNALDDAIDEKIVYAWSDQLGYLTACPTNVGTGMRVSVMLHLPALSATKQFQKMYNSLQKISLTVRGIYGEGSQALGDLYQISNQSTLGVTEEKLIRQVHDVVMAVVGYEKRARDFLLEENREKTQDSLHMSLEMLRSEEKISTADALGALSTLRMGVNMGIVTGFEMSIANLLMRQVQPAHLQWVHGGIESSLDEGFLRAQYIQKFIQNTEILSH